MSVQQTIKGDAIDNLSIMGYVMIGYGGMLIKMTKYLFII